MAASVVTASRNIDALASSLPEVDLNETAQLARIAALQVRTTNATKPREGGREHQQQCGPGASCSFCVPCDDV